MKQEKENLEKDVNKTPESKEPEKPSSEAKTLSLEEKLQAAEKEIYNWKNKYAMMFADMDNLRKSQEKPSSEAKTLSLEEKLQAAEKEIYNWKNKYAIVS